MTSKSYRSSDGQAIEERIELHGGSQYEEDYCLEGFVMDADGRRRSLRERQRQEREELILRAAEEVLLEKGYHNTSIDEIAARVGIAKGTVYLHFASKEALVFALLMRGMQKLIQEINVIIAMKHSARSRLEDILRYVHGELFSEHFQLLYALYESMTARQLILEKKEYVQSRGGRVNIHNIAAHLSIACIIVHVRVVKVISNTARNRQDRDDDEQGNKNHPTHKIIAPFVAYKLWFFNRYTMKVNMG